MTNREPMPEELMPDPAHTEKELSRLRIENDDLRSANAELLKALEDGRETLGKIRHTLWMRGQHGLGDKLTRHYDRFTEAIASAKAVQPAAKPARPYPFDDDGYAWVDGASLDELPAVLSARRKAER